MLLVSCETLHKIRRRSTVLKHILRKIMYNTRGFTHKLSLNYLIGYTNQIEVIIN